MSTEHVRVGPKEWLVIMVTGTALITYLAPIKFPIWAQSSSTAWHISNVKSVGTAVAMYLAESDDRFVPLGYGYQQPRPWTVLLSPYLRSVTVLGKRLGDAPLPNPRLYGTIGLNYSALSTTPGGKLVPRSYAAIKRPEDVLLLVSHAAPPTTLRHTATGIPYVMSIEPPVCPPDNDLCIGGWGTDFWVKKGGMDPRDFAAQHGRVAAPFVPKEGRPRYTVAYVDGHARRMELAQLTEGTDCATPDEVLTRPCKRTGTGTYRWGDQ